LFVYSKNYFKDKNWDIVEVTKTRVDRFKRTMPLVNDLHNKAMRERHWIQIKNESNKTFEENSEEFTLEAIIDLHFEENAQLINEISEAASKEFEIEKGLRIINDKWELTQFETASHKDKGHYKIK
jgi:dynein heavy chain, axonemal